MRPDAFYAATARQIAREFAGLNPGPGFDVAPPPLPSSLPPLSVDEIKWEMGPAETIQADGSPLRSSLIAYRELALAGCHALHGAFKQIDRVEERYHRALDELRSVKAEQSNFRTKCPQVGAVVSHSPGDSDAEDKMSAPKPTGQNVRSANRSLFGLSGVQGVR